jgi:Spy/CpxP family protein refolding chaperone
MKRTKKNIAIATLALGFGLVSLTQAYAGWGQRGGGYCGYWGGSMNQAGPQMQFNQVDPAVQDKLDAFFADTEDIRREIAVKRAERIALLRSENPDPAAASKVAGELFDLRTTLHKKAEEAGVTAYLGPMNGPRAGAAVGRMAQRMGNGRDFVPGNPGYGGMRQGGRPMNNMQPGPGYRGTW